MMPLPSHSCARTCPRFSQLSHVASGFFEQQTKLVCYRFPIDASTNQETQHATKTTKAPIYSIGSACYRRSVKLESMFHYVFIRTRKMPCKREPKSGPIKILESHVTHTRQKPKLKQDKPGSSRVRPAGATQIPHSCRTCDQVNDPFNMPRGHSCSDKALTDSNEKSRTHREEKSKTVQDEPRISI